MRSNTSLSQQCWPKPWCWAKLTCFDFFFNLIFNYQGHILRALVELLLWQMFSFLLEPLKLVGRFSSQDENLCGVVRLFLFLHVQKRKGTRRNKKIFFLITLCAGRKALYFEQWCRLVGVLSPPPTHPPPSPPTTTGVCVCVCVLVGVVILRLDWL